MRRNIPTLRSPEFEDSLSDVAFCAHLVGSSVRQRSRKNEAPHEWHPMLVLLRLTDHQSLINNHVF
jgi:hypothetical protein